MNALAVLKTAVRATGDFVVRHRKAILVTTGGACVTGAIAVAVVQAPVAKEALEALPEPKEDETKVDIIIKEAKTVAPIMWSVPVLAATGMGCFMVALHISGKEVSRAVTDGLAWKQAYNELARIHNDYVKANRKIAGEEIHKKVQEEVTTESNIKAPTTMMITSTGRGNEQFYDTLSGQFFYSSATFIANAAITFAMDMKNGQLANAEGINGFGTAEEWLEQYLMINAGLIFSGLGWYSEDCEGFRSRYCPFRIYLTDHYVTGPDGNPARVIEYDYMPEEP